MIGRTYMAVAMAAPLAAPLAAQDGPRRAGFGMSLGMGAGSLGVTCEDCASNERMDGLSG